MKTTIEGVEYDTDRDEIIANHDTPDNRLSFDLHITEAGQYYLCTERLQVRKNDSWRDVPRDGNAKGVGMENLRYAEEIRPLTEERAIDWCVEKLLPPSIRKVIQSRLGELVSIDEKLAQPLQRYCEAEGVTLSEGLRRAVVNALERDETTRAIALLQTSLTGRFGDEVNTDTGAATLSIAHDEITLTNRRSRVVAQRAASITRFLEKGARA